MPENETVDVHWNNWREARRQVSLLTEAAVAALTAPRTRIPLRDMSIYLRVLEPSATMTNPNRNPLERFAAQRVNE